MQVKWARCQNMKPKYSTYGSCHIVLVTSFGARVCTIEIGRYWSPANHLIRTKWNHLEPIFGKKCIWSILWFFVVWPMSHPRIWRGGVYDLYCSHPAGGDGDSLASVSSFIHSLWLACYPLLLHININPAGLAFSVQQKQVSKCSHYKLVAYLHIQQLQRNMIIDLEWCLCPPDECKPDIRFQHVSGSLSAKCSIILTNSSEIVCVCWFLLCR